MLFRSHGLTGQADVGVQPVVFARRCQFQTDGFVIALSLEKNLILGKIDDGRRRE